MTHGRHKPYTERGLRRLRCSRCGAKKPQFQWQICSDGNLWRPICGECDIELNELVLKFMNDPDRKRKMKEYRKWR